MRHIVISEEQRLLRESAERYLRDRYGFEHREAVRASGQGFDPDAWRAFGEFGWLALPFPEELGGLGGTMLDVALLAETFGPALLAEPFMPTVAAGVALVAAGPGKARDELVPAIAAGAVRLALAFAERGGGYDHRAPGTSARRRGGAYVIDGRKSVVLGAPLADHLIVTARIEGDDGLSLFLVPTDAAGLSLRPYATIDGQRAAEVRLAGVTVAANALIGPAGGGLPIFERAANAGTVCLLGEAAGILQAALDLTIDYLNTREQFGRKLASFQALRHRVALMYVGKEEVRALCRQAAAAFADDPDGAYAAEMISAAKVHVGRVGRHICEEAIQLHGAIAISDEYVVGHYLKRMITIDHMFGNANHHFDRYVATARSLAPAA
jgi:alkylation response protein AidB-like acyl-CoA dehydrogenase